MRKIITLLFCLFLSVGLALADNPIQIRAIFSSGEVKPSEEPPIHATINGDMFTATFIEDLGSVNVSICSAEGGRVFDQAILCTPNGVGCRIPHPGHFIVTFTLPNGDEYYGEFTVTD